MKRRTFFLIIILSNIILPHGQGTHQHLVRQAYALLKDYYGVDIPVMVDHVGNGETGNGGYFWPGGLLVIGAHQEDCIDATSF